MISYTTITWTNSFANLVIRSTKHWMAWKNTCKRNMEWLIWKNLTTRHPNLTMLRYIMHLLWNAPSYYAIQMMLTKWGMAIEFSAIQNFKCCYQGREIIPNINCGYFDTWQTVSVFSPREWPMSTSVYCNEKFVHWCWK